MRPGMVVAQSVCVLLFLPETRGKDLEATFRAFQHHWFWKRHTGILDVHSEPLPLHVKRLQVRAGLTYLVHVRSPGVAHERPGVTARKMP